MSEVDDTKSAPPPDPGTEPAAGARKKATRKKPEGAAPKKASRKKSVSDDAEAPAAKRATRKKAASAKAEASESKKATRKAEASEPKKATRKAEASESKKAARKADASESKKAARKADASEPKKAARKKAVGRKPAAKRARREGSGANGASDEDLAAASLEAAVESAPQPTPDDEDLAPRKPRRRIVSSQAPPPPEEVSVADLLDDDDALEVAAQKLADDVAALDDDEEEPELLIPTDLGPVFVGEVELDTPEQRLEAMRKAAARLGIRALHQEQEEVIDAVLRGEDVLMVLPTGFGKSACYQIPSMILSKPVLVISPLLALMRDQYEKMEQLNLPCVRLDGTVRGGARKRALEQIAAGDRVLVMTTPETLAAPDLAAALAKSGIAMAAVDEAHCISEWGFDFRPAYLQIGERLKVLGAPPVLALTATATEKVRLAIQRFVAMRDPLIVSSSPHRDNLAFDVLHCGGGARHRALVRLALRVRRPGIIYCTTTREVDEMYTVLQRFGIPSHRYHGKMTGSERSKSQDQFMHRGRRTVMVATNAFGLGIDKPDIRYVMHYQSPASLEQYVQEAGRSGRDGRRSNCIMLYSHEDRTVHEALLSRSRVRPEQLYKLGKALAAWADEEKVPSLQALALSAGLGSRTTGALLALLEEATLVRWDQSAVFVTVPPDEIEPRSRLLAGQFETLRTQDARRLDAVAEYATTQGCRAVFLREYFGEEGGESCGMCDRCRGQEDRPSSFWQPLAPPKGELERRKSRKGGRGSKTAGRQTGRGRKTRGGRRRKTNARSASTGSEGRPARPKPKPKPKSANGAESVVARRASRRRRRGRRGGRGRRGRRPEGDSDSREPPQS